MPVTIIKHCIFCGSAMETQRSSKKLCSQSCHNKYHYWRHKVGLSNKEGFSVLKDLAEAGQHPNQQFQQQQSNTETTQ